MPNPQNQKQLNQILDEQKLVLDPATAENSALKTQDQWIEYWNNVNDGRWLPSAAEFYRVFRQAYFDLRDRKRKNDAKSLVKTVRKEFSKHDFPNYNLATGTKIAFYEPESPIEARIMYDYNSSKISQSCIEVPQIAAFGYFPFYYECLDELDVKEFEFLQKLLGTSDTKKQILDVLSTISGRRKSDLIMWVTRSSSDGTAVERPVWFTGGNFFIIIEEHPIESPDSGFSYGVRGNLLDLGGKYR